MGCGLWVIGYGVMGLEFVFFYWREKTRGVRPLAERVRVQPSGLRERWLALDRRARKRCSVFIWASVHWMSVWVRLERRRVTEGLDEGVDEWERE